MLRREDAGERTSVAIGAERAAKAAMGDAMRTIGHVFVPGSRVSWRHPGAGGREHRQYGRVVGTASFGFDIWIRVRNERTGGERRLHGVEGYGLRAEPEEQA